MVKKVLSIFLASMMMLSLLTVSAETNQPETDGFENAAPGPVNLTSGYDTSVWKMTDVYAKATTKMNGALEDTRIGLTVKEEAENNYMEVVQKTSVSSISMTQHSNFDTFDTYFATFKFRIPATNGTGMWLLGAGNTASDGYAYDKNVLAIRDDGYFYKITGANKDYAATYTDLEQNSRMAYTKDTWYTALVKVTQTGFVVSIYGDEGLIISHDCSGDYLRARANLMFAPYCGGSNFILHLDDGSVFTVQSSTQKVDFSGATIDGDTATTEVSLNPTVNLTFDQPVNTTGVTVTDEKGTAVENATVKALTANTLQITMAGLKLSENYTVNFAGVTGMAGNALDNTGTTPLSFTTTAENAATVYTDDFEGKTVPNAERYTSPVWKINEDRGYQYAGIMTNLSDNAKVSFDVIDDAGNDVLMVTQKGTDVALPMEIVKNANSNNAVDPDEKPAAGETIFAAFNFKVPSGQDTYGQISFADKKNMPLTIRANGSIVGGTKAGTYQKDTWYTAFMAITNTSRATYIYDGNGSLYTLSQTDVSPDGWPGLYSQGAPIKDDDNPDAVNDNFTFYLDNSELALITENNTMTLTGSTITGGLWPTVDLTFDLPVAIPAAEAITCVDNEENPLACTATVVNYNTIRVALAPMTANTSYTLNFKGVKGIANNDLYGTESITIAPVDSDETIMIKGLAESIDDNGSVADGSIITVGNAGAEQTATFVVAYYSADDKLVGAEFFADKLVAANGTVDLTLTKAYAGVKEAKVFVLNNRTDLKPLMENFHITK